MVIIAEEYYTEEKVVRLTQQEIEIIIDELERAEHNIFVYLQFDKIIKKLRE